MSAANHHSPQSPAVSAKTITLTWLVLLLVTLLSWWLGHAPAPLTSGLPFEQIAIILLAVLKMYLITLVFMEMLSAPPAWQVYTAGVYSLLAGTLLTLVIV